MKIFKANNYKYRPIDQVDKILVGGYLVINLVLKTETQSNIAPNWWIIANSHGAAYNTVIIPKSI